MHKRRKAQREVRDSRIASIMARLGTKSLPLVADDVPPAARHQFSWGEIPEALDPACGFAMVLNERRRGEQMGRAERKRSQLKSLIDHVGTVVKPGDVVVEFGE
jgi:hypothetical protein